MHETRRLLAALDACRARGTAVVLATLARVRGSHYRKPGARMLLALDGELAGVLSGGCLESDLLEQARAAARESAPRLVRYDLTAVGEELWGFGLGCSGDVEILLEPLPLAGYGPLDPYRRALAARRRTVLATVFAVAGDFAARPGDRAEWTADGELLWASRGAPATATSQATASRDLLAALAATAAEVLATGSPRTIDLAFGVARVAALVEPLAPPVTLFLAGAGRDAVPVARLAPAIGWDLVVIDPRAGAATRGRFPEAESVLAGPPRDWLPALRERLGLDAEATGPGGLPLPAVAIVMTHAYLDDLALLEALLPLPLAYVGLLGPAARRERLLSDLAARGGVPGPAARARLRGPAGLDIGSQTPEEIALAVLAEARAALAGRRGGPLDTSATELRGEPTARETVAASEIRR